MHRREFLKTGGAAALGLAVGGCASRSAPQAAPSAGGPLRRVNLVPVDCSMDRITRTTVGLRPFRPTGWLVKPERFGAKTVIHNYGHGEAGMSMAWGTGALAADLALPDLERRAGVIGCGVIGLTAARQLQRRGFDVTIYAMAVPPHTTSNMSKADFGPWMPRANLLTPQWVSQFRRAQKIAYDELQLLVGPRYGVSWIDHYNLLDVAPTESELRRIHPEPLPDDNIASVLLEPGEHPFASKYATRRPELSMEPTVYLDALSRDVITFGGRIVIRKFDALRDLMALPESLIVNCTGLGARALFGDESLQPSWGQLTVLVPQPEVTYSVASMMPRSDGIVLGGGPAPNTWSLAVNEEAQRQVVERHAAIFRAMRAPRGKM